jgi:hypothetical protein
VTEQALAIMFLVVSIASSGVQGVAFYKLVFWRYGADESQREIHRGLVRTSFFRVLAAALYVGFGVVSLSSPSTTGVLSLVVFTYVQAQWQLNSVLDIRLRRKLGEQAAAAERLPGESGPPG